jgi:hypothetical protein
MIFNISNCSIENKLYYYTNVLMNYLKNMSVSNMRNCTYIGLQGFFVSCFCRLKSYVWSNISHHQLYQNRPRKIFKTSFDKFEGYDCSKNEKEILLAL